MKEVGSFQIEESVFVYSEYLLRYYGIDNKTALVERITYDIITEDGVDNITSGIDYPYFQLKTELRFYTTSGFTILSESTLSYQDSVNYIETISLNPFGTNGLVADKIVYLPQQEVTEGYYYGVGLDYFADGEAIIPYVDASEESSLSFFDRIKLATAVYLAIPPDAVILSVGVYVE